MSTVLFKRGTEADMNETPITDGLLYFCTSNNKIYMDNGNARLQYGGDTTLISNPAQATQANAFNANACLSMFMQKTTIVDSVASALAVTQQYIPLGCLAFKEALGTTNFSRVGDGTISGGLTSLRGETITGTLAGDGTSTTVTLTSTILNSNSYVDIYTDRFSITPTDVAVDNSLKTITLTFRPSTIAVNIKVVVRNM